jgi:hypothetical protein
MSTNVEGQSVSPNDAKPNVTSSDLCRAKGLVDDIETEIIVDKNVKLFNELKAKSRQNQFTICEHRFEKPNGVSNNFFFWTMVVMAIIGLIAAWLS